MADDSTEATRLLQRVRRGDAAAREALWPLVHDELRRLAGAHMRGQAAGHTLQATALVHEVYLRLVDVEVSAEHRAEFFALASRAMRHILVDHARGRARAKRGGDAVQVTLEDGLLAEGAAAERMIALDQALSRLGKRDERKVRAVELRYFGGLTLEQIAESLDVSLSTVRADLRFSLAWLRGVLEGDPSD